MTTARRRPRPPAGGAALTMTPADLEAFGTIDEDKAKAMIEDAIALAQVEAPCLKGDRVPEHLRKAARAIIRAAVLRWHDQGTGSLMMLSADVYGARFDNRTPRTAGGFMDAELKRLRKLCRGGSGAFSIDLAPGLLEPDEPPWMDFVDP